MKTLPRYFRKIAIGLASFWFFGVHAGPVEDFFSAVKRDDASTVVATLLRGFDVNVRDEKGFCALFLAVREPSPQVLDVLLRSSDAEINVFSPQGETPLMMAAIQGNLPLVKRLLDKGAFVNHPGWTPLHYAASKGHLEVMRLLLENHAYIDAESPNQTTPLMMAAHYGTPEAVQLLLEEGADVNLKNMKGLNALDFAQMGQRPDAVEAIARLIRERLPKGSW